MGNSEEMIAEEEENSSNPTMIIPGDEAVTIEFIDEFAQYVVTEKMIFIFVAKNLLQTRLAVTVI